MEAFYLNKLLTNFRTIQKEEQELQLEIDIDDIKKIISNIPDKTLLDAARAGKSQIFLKQTKNCDMFHELDQKLNGWRGYRFYTLYQPRNNPFASSRRCNLYMSWDIEN